MKGASLLKSVSCNTIVDNLATMLWPITILIAISRYRLYEIDRIISRTLGYGLVVLYSAMDRSSARSLSIG